MKSALISPLLAGLLLQRARPLDAGYDGAR
nr:hypothetical protein [Klebsiella pneumoniae]